MKSTLVVLAASLALTQVARAQPAPEGETIELTATIEAIDHTARLVSLKDKDGDIETIYCGPEIKRFDELKVGDTVTFRYYDSIVYNIRKPGQPSGLPKTSGERQVVRHEGGKPGATVSRQETATVTVSALDAKVPSVTVLKEDGDKATFKVKDKKSLENVKVGDKVEITYTQALLISVK
jgi:plastocyanin